MKFTRRNQLWLYVFLSAFSALCQYVIQGAMASGHDPAQFPAWFWISDYALWGARALIEAGVVTYCFATRTTTRAQSVILGIFEFVLIALVTPTVGYALRGLGYGLQVRDMLAEPWLTFWFLGIGAYTSLMMGAAGYAYRVQPQDEGAQLVDTATLQALEEAQAKLAQMQGELAAAAKFEALPPKLRIRWIAEHRNGDGPTNADLARSEHLSASQVGRLVKK